MSELNQYEQKSAEVPKLVGYIMMALSVAFLVMLGFIMANMSNPAQDVIDKPKKKPEPAKVSVPDYEPDPPPPPGDAPGDAPADDGADDGAGEGEGEGDGEGDGSGDDAPPE